MDAGVGDISAPLGGPEDSNGSLEKQDYYRSDSPASLVQGLRPAPAARPYLVPKANVSRESLHSLSDPRDNPYALAYTSAHPSPSARGPSPFSDQQSISGLNSRHLLSTSQDVGHSPVSNASPRMPSPLAFVDAERQSQNVEREDSVQPVVATSEHAQPRPLDNPPQSSHLYSKDRETTQYSTSSLSQDKMPTTKERQGEVSLDRQFTPESVDINQVPSRTGVTLQNIENIDNAGSTGNDPSVRTDHQSRIDANLNGRLDGELNNYKSDSHAHTRNTYSTASKRSLHEYDGEADEDQTTRIHSVYQEYWNDSTYYDGSEEWDALPHQSTTEVPALPRTVPSYPYNRDWRESTLDFNERDTWEGSKHTHPHEQETWQEGQYVEAHERETWEESQYVQPHKRERWAGNQYVQPHYNDSYESWAEPGRAIDSSGPRPYVHPRHSASYSTSSLPARSQTPQLTEPLTELPTTRYKLDEFSSGIAYSKPRRFVGAAERDSPVPRSASPAQLLSSSWSTLPELPVPHRLRRSGSFSSLEFAPSRKFGTHEADAGDTASIRSFARTEASLMAASLGAGRTDRLPQDIVPLGKAGALASLRPQNYGDVRYG
jgi:hypothetical protein